MRVITNTNIVVDDFDFAQDYPKNKFLHFLTHFHQDHWGGMSPLWDYGPIYCTEITQKLILQQFPKIPNITAMEFNKKYTFELNNDQQLQVDVYLFDAFHIPGSAMILFDGFMGRVMFTGDFRFRDQMIYENGILFPQHLRNSREQGISIHVDQLIFDNTYCDPMFNFPKSDVVLKQMIEIIEKNKNQRVLIAMGALGKEDICVQLSKYFQTLLVIKESKLQQLQSIDYNTEIFTTDSEEGWIEIIGQQQRESRIKEEQQRCDNLKALNPQYTKQSGNYRTQFICITTDFLMLDHQDPDGINYIVPYSLHSNFEEMKRLVKAISPSILRRVVLQIFKLPAFKRNQRIQFFKNYSSYVSGLKRKGESGFSQFQIAFTDITKLSDQFQSWMTLDRQKDLLDRLEINLRPNNGLRQRPLKELVEMDPWLEEQIRKIQGKQDSLSDIADKLKSTHNNHLITNFIRDDKIHGRNQTKKCMSEKSASKGNYYNQKQTAKFNDWDQTDEFQCLINAFINKTNDQI